MSQQGGRSRTPRRRVPLSALVMLMFAVAVAVVVWRGERTELLHDSVLWPRQVVFQSGSSVAPTAADPDQEIMCLALNTDFEARGEPFIGKVAVAHVVMNRVLDRRFPTSVCAVVRDGGTTAIGKCQFSWWCDGESDRPRDQQAWAQSKQIAEDVFWSRTADPTRGALWYHADWVAPEWRGSLHQGPMYGQHIFYHDEPQPRLLRGAAP